MLPTWQTKKGLAFNIYPQFFLCVGIAVILNEHGILFSVISGDFAAHVPLRIVSMKPKQNRGNENAPGHAISLRARLNVCIGLTA